MGRIFLDIFLGIPSEYADKWNNYWLSNDTVNKVNNSLILALIGTAIGASFYREIKIRNKKVKSIIKPLKVVLYIFIPFCVAKLWFDFSQVRSNGYVSLYTGLVQSPLILRASWFLVINIFPILLTDLKNKKEFRYLLFLFILIDGLNIAQGARGALFRPLAFFIWYYYKFINVKKIKINKIFYLTIIVTFLSVFMLQLREKDTSKIDNPFYYMLSSLSGTYYNNAYFIDSGKNFLNPSKFYILAPVVDFVKYLYDPDLKGHSVIKVKKTLSLDHKLTYEIAPTSYLAGHGLGGTYISELYALGGVTSVFIISIILGYMIVYFENLFLVLEQTRFISWFWISNLVWMPRGSLLGFVVPMVISYFFYRLLYNFTK